MKIKFNKIISIFKEHYQGFKQEKNKADVEKILNDLLKVNFEKLSFNTLASIKQYIDESEIKKTTHDSSLNFVHPYEIHKNFITRQTLIDLNRLREIETAFYHNFQDSKQVTEYVKELENVYCRVVLFCGEKEAQVAQDIIDNLMCEKFKNYKKPIITEKHFSLLEKINENTQKLVNISSKTPQLEKLPKKTFRA